MRLFTMKMMVAVALLASSSMAMAGTGWTLLDDFEGATPGDVNGQGNWTAANGVYNVAADPVVAGNQILKVETGTTSGGNGSGSNNASIPIGGGIADGTVGTVFFRMQVGGNDTDGGTAGGDFVFGSSDVAAPNAWGDYEGYMRMANGTMDVRGNSFNGGGFSFGQVYNADEWYNVWLVLDNVANKTTLYSSQGTDDAGAALVSGFFRNSGNMGDVNVGDLLTLNLRIGELLDGTDGAIDSIYYDLNGANLTNPIPEPSSLVLVAGCCLLLGAARRQRS